MTHNCEKSSKANDNFIYHLKFLGFLEQRNWLELVGSYSSGPSSYSLAAVLIQRCPGKNLRIEDLHEDKTAISKATGRRIKRKI